jgi:hypothetical protein
VSFGRGIPESEYDWNRGTRYRQWNEDGSPRRRYEWLSEEPAQGMWRLDAGGYRSGVTADWEPTNGPERTMAAARARGDVRTELEVVARVPLLLPTPPGDPAPGGRPQFVVWPYQGEKRLVAFTSVPALASVFGDEAVSRARVTTYPELLQNWPDPVWKLAVNPNLPIDVHVNIEQLAELLEPGGRASTLAGLLQGIPDGRPAARRAAAPPDPVPLVKVLPPNAAATYLQGGYNRVSGFVYVSDALPRLSSPRQLYQALGLADGMSPFSPKDESVHLIRWYSHLPQMYPLAYGACDERAFALIGGSLVEPEPFVGVGQGAGDVLAAQMKVDALVLPHGAQLSRLDRFAGECALASYDADLRSWVELATRDVESLLRS